MESFEEEVVVVGEKISPLDTSFFLF